MAPVATFNPVPSTTSQRAYIRSLLRGLELPTDRVTVLHRDLFQNAGISWRDDVPMDAALEGINGSQARRLILALAARGGDAEDE